MRLDRYRSRALARPARRWVLGLVLAAVTFALVRGAVARAETARARWGTARTVWVARTDLRPGDALDGALARADRPVALVGDGALDGHEPPPAGARVAVGVLAGDVVRRGHLAGAGAARPADGRRTVALPRPDGLTLAVGDRVEVADAAGATVATAAVVVAVADATVEASVAADDLGAVARALADGRVVLALSG